MGERACVNCFAPLTGGPVCPRCGFDNAAYRPLPHHLPPGVILRDQYVVGRAMGQGGFGITYAGFDTSLDRRVAVKEYFPEGTAIREAARTARVSCYAAPSFQERYEAGMRKYMNEAKSLARLDDIPGIVRVLGYFQENNTAYIIMEFVEGVTLVSYLKRLPRRPGYREALSLLAPIGGALRRVHERGFVHRDVSPDNIMVNREGEPKLLDFGAVKTVTEGGTPTETPVIKRGFSPNEMYSVKGKIGPWSDVYAYCATLFYMLTGTALEEPMDRAAGDTTGESLSRVISPAQTAALLKGLAIQQEQRYSSIAEMTAALNACRNDPAPVPQPEPAPVPATAVIDRPAPAPADDKPAPETVQIDNPPPETVVIGQPAPKKPEPETIQNAAPPKSVPVPETELAGNAAPERKTPPPAAKPGVEKQPPVKPAPEKAGVAHTPKADAPGAVITAPPKPGGKKKTGVIIAAAVAVIVALCVVIGIAAGKSSGNVSTTSTTQAPSTTKAPSTTAAPTTTQTPSTTQAPATTIPPTTAPADTVAARIASANVGDYVIFGSYEQDNDTSNGKEDIEWQVLAKEDGKALLLSRYGLDCQKYNETSTSVTWETCTLRTWLNDTFLNGAFSFDEQRQIADSTVTADKNPSYSIDPGNDTTDEIFLLSIQEAEKYFSTTEERKCQPTAYAKAQGASSYYADCCVWWLRSPGSHDNWSSVVNYLGYLDDGGDNVVIYSVAVRPALWINLTS